MPPGVSPSPWQPYCSWQWRASGDYSVQRNVIREYPHVIPIKYSSEKLEKKHKIRVVTKQMQSTIPFQDTSKNVLSLEAIMMYLGAIIMYLREIMMYLRDIIMYLREIMMYLRDIIMYLREIIMYFREIMMYLREIIMYFREIIMYLREIIMHLMKCFMKGCP